MENAVQKLQASLTSQGVNPKFRNDITQIMDKEMSESSHDTKHSYLKFLKDQKDIVAIYHAIKNKKLTNNQIRNEIKKYLNDPEDLKLFLKKILESNLIKKEESKESTGASSAGGYSAPLFSTTKGDITKGVETVREEVLKGGKSDKMTIEDIVKKHEKNGDNMTSTIKKQLKKGIDLEMEHTDDEDIAKEIAMDHLYEDPNYYDKLKKVETKEATTSASSGQYSSPAIWAKSMKKKDFAGYRKPLYKGGKFVQVKKKCKKFPYCNQGDVKALKIFENENVQNAIDSVSSRYEIDRSFISELVYQKIRKSIN